jgi:mannosyltransferase OCH1-like enzyme
MTEQIPRILHFIWFGNQMPADLADNVRRIESVHQDWSCIHWDERLTRVVLGLDTNRLRCEYMSWAGVSNVVRLEALRQFGGVYLDADFACHRRIPDEWLEHSAIAAVQDESGRICNAFMGASAHHPWIEAQWRSVPNWSGHGAEWGVYSATDAPRDGLTLIDSRFIYPFCYNTPASLRVLPDDAVLSHQWRNEWN